MHIFRDYQEFLNGLVSCEDAFWFLGISTGLVYIKLRWTVAISTCLWHCQGRHKWYPPPTMLTNKSIFSSEWYLSSNLIILSFSGIPQSCRTLNFPSTLNKPWSIHRSRLQFCRHFSLVSNDVQFLSELIPWMEVLNIEISSHRPVYAVICSGNRWEVTMCINRIGSHANVVFYQSPWFDKGGTRYTPWHWHFSLPWL